jgi:hypothetical protein
MISLYADTANVKAMVAALRKVGLPVESTTTTHTLTLRGRVVFEATKAPEGIWSVKHHPAMFQQ